MDFIFKMSAAQRITPDEAEDREWQLVRGLGSRDKNSLQKLLEDAERLVLVADANMKQGGCVCFGNFRCQRCAFAHILCKAIKIVLRDDPDDEHPNDIL
jgi:hypothetical protein